MVGAALRSTHSFYPLCIFRGVSHPRDGYTEKYGKGGVKMKNLQGNNAHLLLLLGWVFYFLFYVLTERLIPWGKCHLIHIPLDDVIPFHEFFVIFYAGWYFLIVGSLLYFLGYSVKSFIKLQTYIIIVQSIAILVYILYPSRQELRPEIFPRQNLLTWIMGILYAADTNTGVFPSLHVAISLGIASTWLREKSVKLWVRILIALFCLGVCASVAFVKQHSVLDILGAIPVCMIAEWLVFLRKGNCRRTFTGCNDSVPVVKYSQKEGDS